MRIGSLLSTILIVMISFAAGVLSVQTVAPDLLSGKPGTRLPEAVTARLHAAGDFSGVDTIRRAEGRAQLLDAGDIRILRFTAFDVSPAPHLRVWLSSASEVRSTEDVRAHSIRDLGPLVRTEGDQVYLIPEGLALDDYRSVLIWSSEFGVLYGVAELQS